MGGGGLIAQLHVSHDGAYHPMRPIVLLTAMIAVLSLPARAPADQGSLMEGMKKQAEPLLYALGLLGSPYKSGGTDPAKGVDCSGFVSHVYKKSASVELPHSAKAMSKNGAEVDKQSLKPGDLVFFNTLKKPFSHVGIYAGDGKFVHASSRKSKQVVLSDLHDHYWEKTYNGARRVLPETP